MLRQLRQPTVSYSVDRLQRLPVPGSKPPWWMRRHWALPSGQRNIKLTLECEVLAQPQLYSALLRDLNVRRRPSKPPLDSLLHLLPRRSAAASVNSQGCSGWLDWRHAPVIAEQVQAICRRSFTMHGAERRLLPMQRTKESGLVVETLLGFKVPVPTVERPRRYINLIFNFMSDDGDTVDADGLYPAQKAVNLLGVDVFSARKVKVNVHIRRSTEPVAARDAAELLAGVADCLAFFNDGFFTRHHRAIHALDEFPRGAPVHNTSVRYGDLIYRHGAPTFELDEGSGKG